MRQEEIVSTDPRIMSGTPIFAGTRVPVESLLAHLAAGETLDDFLDGFPGVKREQAEAFLAMRQARMIRYDAEADALMISFGEARNATGFELNENILLRIDQAAGEAVGLTVFNFSVLAQPTEMGPRSVPLTGLTELSPDLREMALSILQRAPVSDHLKLSAFAPSANPSELLPIVSVEALAASSIS